MDHWTERTSNFKRKISQEMKSDQSVVERLQEAYHVLQDEVRSFERQARVPFAVGVTCVPAWMCQEVSNRLVSGL